MTPFRSMVPEMWAAEPPRPQQAMCALFPTHMHSGQPKRDMQVVPRVPRVLLGCTRLQAHHRGCKVAAHKVGTTVYKVGKRPQPLLAPVPERAATQRRRSNDSMARQPWQHRWLFTAQAAACLIGSRAWGAGSVSVSTRGGCTKIDGPAKL